MSRNETDEAVSVVPLSPVLWRYMNGIHLAYVLPELIVDKEGYPWKLMWEIKPSEIIKAIPSVAVANRLLSQRWVLCLFSTGASLKTNGRLVGVGGRSPIYFYHRVWLLWPFLISGELWCVIPTDAFYHSQTHGYIENILYFTDMYRYWAFRYPYYCSHASELMYYPMKMAVARLWKRY